MEETSKLSGLLEEKFDKMKGILDKMEEKIDKMEEKIDSFPRLANIGKVEKERNIIKNQIMCNSCFDVIESTHRHDYKQCKCKKVSVDGGNEYLKRSFQTGATYEELSIYDDEDFSHTHK